MAEIRITCVKTSHSDNVLGFHPPKLHDTYCTTHQTVEAARAEAERIKRIGEAEAYAVEAVGRSEAESMKMKAAAFKQYGEAAITAMVLESLPQVRDSI